MTRIRIGNQTAVSAATPTEPFEFALRHGFEAFEWFADKKWDAEGNARGWDERDINEAARARFRAAGHDHDVLFTVHAPWQANPLHAEGIERLFVSLEFADAIGAGLVNLHLYMDDGPAGFVHALTPVVQRARALGMQLSLENTPHTTPGDFNQTFAAFRASGARNVGMCLDMGHANLCAETHNDYVQYVDALDVAVPIIHLHVHENYGDADSHLTLFTGPSRANDAGVRALLERLRRRAYAGALILEQWPRPPELLVEAATRLRTLLSAPACGFARGTSS